MALFLIIGAGLIVLAVLWKLAALSRGAMFLVGAALSLGLVGYALQGHPGVASAFPQTGPEAQPAPSGNDDTASNELIGRFGGEAETLKQAEAYFKIRRPDLAARVIKLGLARNRNSPALWTGLGNALVAHSKGALTPAAQFAYDRALRMTPGYPGALYFYAVTLAENGRADEARPLFRQLLDGVPMDSPFRAQLESDLSRAGLLEAADSATAK